MDKWKNILSGTDHKIQFNEDSAKIFMNGVLMRKQKPWVGGQMQLPIHKKNSNKDICYFTKQQFTQCLF